LHRPALLGLGLRRSDQISIICATQNIPEKELYNKVSQRSFVKLPMLDGRAPLRDVYDMVRLCRLLSCPMDEGRVPLSLNEYIYSVDKLDMHPMVSGIAPSKQQLHKK
jgi:hypothetical protein